MALRATPRFHATITPRRFRIPTGHHQCHNHRPLHHHHSADGPTIDTAYLSRQLYFHFHHLLLSSLRHAQRHASAKERDVILFSFVYQPSSRLLFAAPPSIFITPFTPFTPLFTPIFVYRCRHWFTPLLFIITPIIYLFNSLTSFTGSPAHYPHYLPGHADTPLACFITPPPPHRHAITIVCFAIGLRHHIFIILSFTAHAATCHDAMPFHFILSRASAALFLRHRFTPATPLFITPPFSLVMTTYRLFIYAISFSAHY